MAIASSEPRRFAFLFLGLMCAVWLTYKIKPNSQPQSRIKSPLPKVRNARHTASPEFLELQKLQKVLEWPDSPWDVPLSSSTSPEKSHYKLLYVQSNYKVGDKLLVRLESRDHHGQLKEYGGDFIRAKVHTPELKASVSGTVQDHNNGTYTLTFPLLWAGKVQVSVRLIHSGEAVQVLKHIRHSQPSTVAFLGFFIDPAQQKKEEKTECNVHPPTGPVCEYVDSGTGERWFCSKPQHHPCSALVYHSAGRYKTVIPSSKSAFLDRSVTDQNIPGSVPVIEVLPSPQVTVVSPPQPCQPDLNPTNPPGFYYKDVWVSLECSSKAFPTPDVALSCLRRKIIYMIGDSTLRQWWEFLVGFIPSLKKIDLHVNYPAGPLMAVEPTQGTLLRWRAHGLPLRTTKSMIADLHYLANELDAIGGSPDTVVAFTLWAHFTTFPLELYVRRLQRVRQSVIRLLARSPHTLIVIKTANTGYKSVYGSDWFSMQLDSILRAMFAGINVAFVDAWAMSSCHYLPDDVHPGKVIVQNEINSFLSFICPRN